MILNPTTYPTAWDTITLDGKQSPGQAEVKGAGTPRDWDVQKGLGLSGAFLRYTGDNVAKFSVAIRIGYEGFGGRTVEQQWEDWESFKTVVEKSPRGQRPKALSIFHPALAELKIVSVVVEDRSQFEQVEPGVWETVIKFIEFRAPLPAIAQPKSSGPEKDAIDQYIDGLTSQVQDLASPTTRDRQERFR